MDVPYRASDQLLSSTSVTTFRKCLLRLQVSNARLEIFLFVVCLGAIDVIS
jgi:hypothetical protein